MTGPQAAWLADGRLHLNHGPIDLIVSAEGQGAQTAYDAAAARFASVLTELVADLPRLRQPEPRPFTAPIARAMAAATRPFAPEFITPMAAVAGAVADDILLQMTRAANLHKAIVNNGGDIALHLAPGASFTAMMPGGRITLDHVSPSRGIATSGRGGRSHSLGIADAVTVLAANAAAADAAATMIANQVDLPGHPSVLRTPANLLSPDSDLGDRPVTTGLGPLTADEVAQALARGAAYAAALIARGLIHAAHLCLNDQSRTVDPETAIEKDPAHA
ncbi:hypothetical protein ATO6_10775 [Oceanicola sp. 22II-s10i]|uniref:hypothetical protein n=1 Tax=Oceanicola sp. 22II-s10i TaxID=1317116 RepID=UPI000B528C9F|nr:hypothetical protein [Oceanicola sp. 22II-s10i]OWU84797.1 hypothetical protein ATO6_10775 [Oceanicola sp. 22II-s10i]